MSVPSYVTGRTGPAPATPDLVSGVEGHGERPPAPTLLAVVPVRAATLPNGADETVAECGGRALLIGDGVAEAAQALTAATTQVRLAETGAYRPASWAAALAELLGDEDVIVLPGSPDGRDLAPRLAHALSRPLWAGASAVADRVSLARFGGRVLAEVALHGTMVATLVPGVTNVEPGPRAEPEEIKLELAEANDPELIELVPPTAETMDLAEAPRVFAGGAGLGSEQEFSVLAGVAAKVDASMGATRIIVDAGWVPFERQIGTTGVSINPRLYVAFGISGAVQHITGIGNPDHVISVNTDPSCPMMAVANLAVVADAPSVLAELGKLLTTSEEPAHA